MPHYYMFHKPFGCVTARRDDRYPTVMDYFKELHNDRLSPVGRLDRETTGLLLITDDGIFNQKLTHPSYHKEKTYEFTLLGDLTPELVHKLETGVILKGADTLTAPAKITVTGHAVMSDILSTLPEEIQKDIHKNRPDHPITWDNYHFRREETTDPAHDEVCSLLCDRIKTYFHRRHCT